MSKSFGQSKDEIAKLCRYFANNRQAFRAPGVKEAHIRLFLVEKIAIMGKHRPIQKAK